jgi:hypothetical protein
MSIARSEAIFDVHRDDADHRHEGIVTISWTAEMDGGRDGRRGLKICTAHPEAKVLKMASREAILFLDLQSIRISQEENRSDVHPYIHTLSHSSIQR